jgi:hypothetical protein
MAGKFLANGRVELVVIGDDREIETTSTGTIPGTTTTPLAVLFT